MSRSVSLLYRTGVKPEDKKQLFREAVKEDLNLDKILGFLSPDEKSRKKAVLQEVLLDLETDIENLNYRLDITEDLVAKPQLPGRILEITSQARTLAGDRKTVFSYRRTNPFRQLYSSVELLQKYLELLEKLADVLKDKSLYYAEGLQKLAEYVVGYATSADYQNLIAILEQMKKSRGAFELHLNVKRDLSYRLRQAVLIDLDSGISDSGESKGRSSLLDGLLGRRQEKLNRKAINDARLLAMRSVIDTAETPLLHLGGIVSSITSALMRFFNKLETEMMFYQGVVELIQTLEELGLPVCRPQFVSSDIKQFEASGVYDLSFALYMAAKEGFSPDSIVKNEVQMNSSKGQIFIVTEPNQGGKTTYLRAVGITQLFAQAGILVPTERAVISPVDRIYTHFSSVEKTGTDRGRLEEEMILLNQIMQAVSGDSLLLMNESFSSTNSREGTIIAEEILRALSLIGTRVIFVTHLYELAKRIDSINSITNGITKLVSLVAGIERSTSSETGNPKKSIKRTYIVAPGEPLPTGYADDIAYQYGISYEELIQKTNNIR